MSDSFQGKPAAGASDEVLSERDEVPQCLKKKPVAEAKPLLPTPRFKEPLRLRSQATQAEPAEPAAPAAATTEAPAQATTVPFVGPQPQPPTRVAGTRRALAKAAVVEARRRRLRVTPSGFEVTWPPLPGHVLRCKRCPRAFQENQPGHLEPDAEFTCICGSPYFENVKLVHLPAAYEVIQIGPRH